MLLTREDIDNYLKNCGSVTWGTSFTVTSDDTRALAVDWFMKQIEKIQATKKVDNLDPSKEILVTTPTGSIKIKSDIRTILEDFIPADKTTHGVAVIHFRSFNLQFRFVDDSIETEDDLIMALKLSDTLEVVKWP